MPETVDRVALLAERCEVDLGNTDLWFRPDGYPHSVALCIIHAISSVDAHDTSVKNIVRNYVDYRHIHGGNAETDTVSTLLRTFGELGSPRRWAAVTNNRESTSAAPGAPLKAEAIRDAADLLRRYGVDTSLDLRTATDANLVAMKNAWITVPGQHSGASWNHFLTLAGIPGVEADHMVVRYVARALGTTAENTSAADAGTLVRLVAERTGYNTTHLDQAIRRFESGRPVNNSWWSTE